MIRDLKAFYVAILDNEVVCFETNLKKFVPVFAKLESSARNYDWFYRRFKASQRFTIDIGGKAYWFQKVV